MTLAIKSKGCPSEATKSSINTIKVINDQPVNARRLRRRGRHLQSATYLTVEFEMQIEAYCSNSDCTDAQVVGNAIYAEATGNLRKAIEDGSFVGNLQATSSELSVLFKDAVASGNFSPVVIPILNFIGDWYPNWRVGPTSVSMMVITRKVFYPLRSNFCSFFYNFICKTVGQAIVQLT